MQIETSLHRSLLRQLHYAKTIKIEFTEIGIESPSNISPGEQLSEKRDN